VPTSIIGYSDVVATVVKYGALLVRHCLETGIGRLMAGFCRCVTSVVAMVVGKVCYVGICGFLY